MTLQDSTGSPLSPEGFDWNLKARQAFAEHTRKGQEQLSNVVGLGVPLTRRHLHRDIKELELRATTLRMMGKSKASRHVRNAIDWLESAREELT